MRTLTSVAFALLAIVSTATAGFKQGQTVKVDHITVFQVVDGTTLMGEVEYERVWIDDVSTDGMVDGKGYTLTTPLFLVVVGTKTYTTVLGGSKTIMRLRRETSGEADKRRENEVLQKVNARADAANAAAEKNAVKENARMVKAGENAEIRDQQRVGAAARKLKMARGLYFEALAKSDKKEAERLRGLAAKYLDEVILESEKDSAEEKEAKALLKSLR